MDYFKEWLRVIDVMDQDNTYKAAWGRAIIECIVSENYEINQEKYILHEYEIVQKLMKYYWNQIAYFQLSQGPATKIEKQINSMRQTFLKSKRNKVIHWYDKVESDLKRNPQVFENIIKKFMTLSSKDFAIKFSHVKRDRINLYDIDAKLKQVIFTKNQIDSILNNQEILIDLIHYKWAKILETYNKSPNIIKKVVGATKYRFKTCQTTKQRNLLIQYYHLEGVRDFYTNELVDIQNIVIDYVIPYNFIYSCDIWNLVICSKETLKKRNNQLPTKQEIEQLNTRNEKLLSLIKHTHLSDRYDLENCIKNNLVTRYFADIEGEYK
jgi:hypothetical protein